MLFAVFVVLAPEGVAAQGSSALEHYEVKQDGNRFDVLALISDDGVLTGIQVLPDVGSILLTMETNSEAESELRIVLPRALIDARDHEDDSEFLIIVDGEDTEYEELRTTNDERELAIVLPEGTSEVEIFGTHIVPEFPFVPIITAISLAIAVVIASSKPRFHR